MVRKIIGCCFVLLVAGSHAFASSEDAPAWLRQAAAATAPAYAKDVPAVMLLNEQKIFVGEDGRVTTVTTRVIRILTREGRESAVAGEIYQTDTGKVREMKGWLIRPSGSIKAYGKDAVLDAAAAPNDVYNEVRVKLIIAKDDAEVGSVFGYQTTTEDRSIFTQFRWDFQDRLPALASRFTLALPAGWRAAGVTFNHAKIEPTIDSSTYSWELRDLAPIAPEPASPAVTTLAPRLAVSYYPATGAQTSNIKTFNDWAEVSKWLSELSDPQAVPDDALAAKAKQLTAGAKTEFERIEAIGRYVQHIQYISIDIGVGRGGGYRPHAASQVFAKSYGDCKDKANLMRAMLKAVGIESYLVSIFSGDPTYVREEWASPHQFNHCIIAVKVKDDTQAATVIKHPTLGRLLIFDATDDDTPVGDLPGHEQGSLALIVAGSAGALMRMPATTPEANKSEGQTEAVLTGDGALTATLHETAIGQAAVDFRRQFHHLARPQYTKLIESWIARTASGAIVSKIEPTDNPASAGNRFAINVEFTADRYAQLMNNRLLVFKPAIVSHRASLVLTERTRNAPIMLEANSYTETVRVQLPAGFDIDEMPDPVKLETPFGAYTATYETKDGKLLFTRALTVRTATIPAEQYEAVRNFFDRIHAAEQAPVVLAKK